MTNYLHTTIEYTILHYIYSSNHYKMKNLVTHNTTKEEVSVLYRVVMPSTFGVRNFRTLQEAVNERNEIGTFGSEKTPEQIKYWEAIKDQTIIERIVETSKRVV
jgi:hypothetical protein